MFLKDFLVSLNSLTLSFFYTRRSSRMRLQIEIYADENTFNDGIFQLYFHYTREHKRKCFSSSLLFMICWNFHLAESAF